MKQRTLTLILLLFLSPFAFAEDSETADMVEYVPLNPDFVVNLKGDQRSYLRTNIELMVKGKEHADRIRMHMPVLRHAVLMLISEYSADQLESSEQREEFRKKAFHETKTALEKYASSEGLSDLFFTSFLVQ